MCSVNHSGQVSRRGAEDANCVHRKEGIYLWGRQPSEAFCQGLPRARDPCYTALLPGQPLVPLMLDHPRPTKIKEHMTDSGHKTVGWGSRIKKHDFYRAATQHVLSCACCGVFAQTSQDYESRPVSNTTAGIITRLQCCLFYLFPIQTDGSLLSCLSKTPLSLEIVSIPDTLIVSTSVLVTLIALLSSLESSLSSICKFFHIFSLQVFY